MDTFEGARRNPVSRLSMPGNLASNKNHSRWKNDEAPHSKLESELGYPLSLEEDIENDG